VAQEFHFVILRIEVTRASRGLSAIAELLVFTCDYVTHPKSKLMFSCVGLLYRHNDVRRYIQQKTWCTLKKTIVQNSLKWPV